MREYSTDLLLPNGISSGSSVRVHDFGDDIYRLFWSGPTRIPCCQLSKHKILWTQHGLVYTEKGRCGTYTRLLDSGEQHDMNIEFDQTTGEI